MAKIVVHLDPEFVPWGHTKQRRKALPKGAAVVFAALLLAAGVGVLYFGIASQSKKQPDADVVVAEAPVSENGGETLELPSIPIPANEPGTLVIVQGDMVTLFRCNPSNRFRIVLAGGEVITRTARDGAIVEVDQPIEGVSCE